MTTSLKRFQGGPVGDRAAISLCCDFERRDDYEIISVFA